MELSPKAVVIYDGLLVFIFYDYFFCQLYKEDRTATGFTLNRFFLSMHSYLYVFTGYNNTNTAN